MPPLVKSDIRALPMLDIMPSLKADLIACGESAGVIFVEENGQGRGKVEEAQRLEHRRLVDALEKLVGLCHGGANL